VVEENLDTHMQENEIGCFSHITYKMNPKWIKYLSTRYQAVKLLEDVREKLPDIGLGNDCVKLKSFCPTKEAIISEKGQLWTGRKYL
jgi:hypothetical protein